MSERNTAFALVGHFQKTIIEKYILDSDCCVGILYFHTSEIKFYVIINPLSIIV